MKDNVKTTISLTRELYEWVRKYAFDKRTSISETIRQALSKMKEGEVNGKVEKE